MAKPLKVFLDVFGQEIQVGEVVYQLFPSMTDRTGTANALYRLFKVDEFKRSKTGSTLLQGRRLVDGSVVSCDWDRHNMKFMKVDIEEEVLSLNILLDGELAGHIQGGITIALRSE